MRGDEPRFPVSIALNDEVNPTCVGMNRALCPARRCLKGKPHMCGDEPDRDIADAMEQEVNPICVGMNRYQRISGNL